MFHFIYKTSSISGKYYIGRHSTKNVDDSYLGSGRWVNSIKNKEGLTREILVFCQSEEELRTIEEKYLLENVGKPNCMNFNLSSVGFSSGKLNPNSSEEAKKRLSTRMKHNNPMQSESVRDKVSAALMGRESPNRGKKMGPEFSAAISRSRMGIKMSLEGREKLAIARKLQYAGKPSFYSWEGKEHTEETRRLQSIAATARVKKVCPHCLRSFQPNIWSRWHNDNCKKKRMGL